MRSVPDSGSRPDATIGLSSKRGWVAGFCGVAIVSSVDPPPLSEPPHAARIVLRLERPMTPAAERPMNSRRPNRLSRGCSDIPTSQALLPAPARVNQRTQPRSIREDDERIDRNGFFAGNDQRVHLDGCDAAVCKREIAQCDERRGDDAMRVLDTGGLGEPCRP